MFSTLKNWTINLNRYREHPEAMIVSCFFNPQNSPYRMKAFNTWYNTIKHLPHKIIECIIGDSKPQLPENENIQRVYTENLLWHKESLLNLIISKLPPQYKYVFWVDADVIFTNLNWITDSVKALKNGANIMQPFEYCIHLEKDEIKPSFNVDNHRLNCGIYGIRYPKMWRSFMANCTDNIMMSNNTNYDIHGHVGFAWGARREILEKCPLYDKALIGGADHIIAHAAVGQIPHTCIQKSFTENIDEVNEWSKKFYDIVKGKVAYAKGDLYHIWHGDIDKRQYLKRIKDFTPTTKQITQKDKNGLYVTKKGDDEYIKKYFAHREVSPTNSHDNSFMDSMMMGYMTDSTLIGTMYGGNWSGAMLGASLRSSGNSSNQNNGGGIKTNDKNHDMEYAAPIQKISLRESQSVPMYSEGDSENFS